MPRKKRCRDATPNSSGSPRQLAVAIANSDGACVVGFTDGYRAMRVELDRELGDTICQRIREVVLERKSTLDASWALEGYLRTIGYELVGETRAVPVGKTCGAA